ncbi:MAG TPA: Asp-tRNA(Asn)/Glu-tRNA(Gln) amidotransferase subunit GatC [Phycisphaerales bacterium]|nr:Asp-tRNA(Asn)/Glu-tRNA(Gln) amidotransferase subunit GatC [Phycisphaerales bacterium]
MTDHAGTRDQSSRLSAEAVRKVARLSRLALDESQVERYRGQLAAVLGYMERLGELDLANVEPLLSTVEETNRLDDDEPGPTVPTATLLALAPDTLEPFLKVPKVLGEGSA